MVLQDELNDADEPVNWNSGVCVIARKSSLWTFKERETVSFESSYVFFREDEKDRVRSCNEILNE